MPEGIPAELKGAVEVLMESAKWYPDDYPEEQMVKDLGTERGERLIGSGGECVVLAGNEGKVVAINYREGVTAKEQKLVFYRQRVMEALFPNNFPHFSEAWGEWKSFKYAFTQRGELDLLDSEKAMNEAREKFEEIEKVIEELRLPLRLDATTENIALGKDGNAYYVDTIKRGSGEWDKDRVMKHMRNNHYPYLSVEIVEKSIDRLKQLGD